MIKIKKKPAVFLLVCLCCHNLDSMTSEDPEIHSKSLGKMKQSHSVHFELDKDKLLTEEDKSNTDIEGRDKNSDHHRDKLGKPVPSSYMIRSETYEFQQIHYSHTINICDVAGESVKWLCHRLGPLLTAKYLSKNLVRMLALCYLGSEQIIPLTEKCEYFFPFLVVEFNPLLQTDVFERVLLLQHRTRLHLSESYITISHLIYAE